MKQIIRFGFIALILMGFCSQASATLVLELTDGTNTISIADGSAADSIGITGFIGFIDAFGDYAVTSSIGISNAESGLVPAILHLDASVTSLSSNSDPSALTISLFDNSFFAPAGNTTASTTVSAVLADGATASFDSYLNGSLLASSTGASASSTAVNLTNPYSLMLVATIDHPMSPFSTSSFNFEVKVPEPTSIALLGLGLLGLGFASKKRKST